MADSAEYVARAAAWADLDLDPTQLAMLHRYRSWLADEAIKAGGIGPHERGRVWRRHIADSLLFAIGVERGTTCTDLGSGVGLPGLPLAIALPDTSFRLVERSRRRCDLLRRAVRIMELSNCVVVEQDFANVEVESGSIVSRALLPPIQLIPVVINLLVPAIIGYSHDKEPPPLPSKGGLARLELITVPPEVLDTAVHLLRIVPN